MKKNYFSAILIPFCLLACTSLQAQKKQKNQLAFQRGSLLVSISEGSTIANYKTNYQGSSVMATPGRYKDGGIEDDSHTSPSPIHGGCMDGERDPLIIEYGITNKISMGMTFGNDIFTINPAKFYGFSLSNGENIRAKTSEVTFDGSYHFFVNKRLDLSAFGGLGFFSVNFTAKDAPDANPYTYTGNGSMARGGLRVRYYFFHRLGAFGQISSYMGKCSPKGVSEEGANTLSGNYTTQISGSAIEAGLCYRFIK